MVSLYQVFNLYNYKYNDDKNIVLIVVILYLMIKINLIIMDLLLVILFDHLNIFIINFIYNNFLTILNLLLVNFQMVYLFFLLLIFPWIYFMIYI